MRKPTKTTPPIAATAPEPVNNFGRYVRRERDGRPSRPVGRYDAAARTTRAPAGGLGTMPASRNARTAVAAVVDPYGNGRERVLATVNRRVDVLEDELAHKHISEAAYAVGRELQAVFEVLGRVGGSNWAGGSRVDPGERKDNAMVAALEQAQRARALFDTMRDRLGEIDTRLIRRVLGERTSYGDCAALQGKAGDRGARYVAARFREALEDWAEARAAKGKARPTPDDKYREVADAVEETGAARQASRSI